MIYSGKYAVKNNIIFRKNAVNNLYNRRRSCNFAIKFSKTAYRRTFVRLARRTFSDRLQRNVSNCGWKVSKGRNAGGFGGDGKRKSAL
jgi:hypothetical protein